MSKRISLLLIAAALFFGTAIPGTSRAASGTTRPTVNAPGGRFKAALARLDLSAVQKARIKQILVEYKDEAGDKAGSPTTQPVASAARVKVLVKKIMAVLTTEQKAKLGSLLKASKTGQG
jgi:Spy/CpxP family protein refolding chaperone